MKHEHSKGQQMKTSQRLGVALVVACQSTKPAHPGKTALHNPSTWKQHKPTLGIRQPDDIQVDPLLLGCLAWGLPGVALVHEGQFDALSCRFLHHSGQFADLRPILLIGRGHMQRQEMPQGIDGQMHLASFSSLRSIVPRSMSTFWGRLQRTAVENGSRGLFVASLRQTQHGTQVRHDRFKDTRSEPALGLLIHGRPWRQATRASCAIVRWCARSTASR